MASTRMMQMLLEQAERDRQLAETELQRAQGNALEAQRQMQRLLDYQFAYRQKWGQVFREDSSEETVQNYRSLMSRLQARISTQDQATRRQVREAQTARENVVQLEQRVQVLRRALARHDEAVAEPPSTAMGFASLSGLDVQTGLQQVNGFFDTLRDASSFHTTLVDIDLPIIPTWKPLDAAGPDGGPRKPRR